MLSCIPFRTRISKNPKHCRFSCLRLTSIPYPTSRYRHKIFPGFRISTSIRFEAPSPSFGLLLSFYKSPDSIRCKKKWNSLTPPSSSSSSSSRWERVSFLFSEYQRQERDDRPRCLLHLLLTILINHDMSFPEGRHRQSRSGQSLALAALDEVNNSPPSIIWATSVIHSYDSATG